MENAIGLEIEQIKEYQVFKNYGKAVYEKDKIGDAPKGYQKIRVHFVFNIIYPDLHWANQVAVHCWGIDCLLYHNDHCFARGWVVMGKGS